MTDFDRTIGRLNNELAKAYGAPLEVAKALTASAAPKDDDEAPGEIDGQAFMAKAMKSHARGDLTSAQLTEAELSINARKAPPPKIVKAVMSGEPYSEWG